MLEQGLEITGKISNETVSDSNILLRVPPGNI